MDVIYESRETFSTSTTIPEAIAALERSLNDAGYKTQATASSVTASTGSNLAVRLWGTSLPWGQKNVPVAMTVSFSSTPTGTTAEAHAHDKLGWFIDAKTNHVFREEAPRKIADLIEIARRSLKS
ncbi:hypothetical protein ACX80N_17555 [Arthrobacter sp. MDT2-16]